MARSGVEILHTGAHSASISDLSRSMGAEVQILDFCIPCNPYFPTPEMFAELSRDLAKILKYYPSDASTITAKLSSVLGLHPQTVAMANGSTELITWIDHLLIKSSVAIPIPTFGRWTDQPLETGKRVDMFTLRERDGFRLNLDEYVQFIRDRGSRVAVVCNVNNPDGGYLARRDVIRFMDQLADLDLVVIDESFIDFSDAEQFPSVGPEAVIRPNVVVLKSLGKNFGLHGIRFGYLMANPAIAGRIAKALPKWNLNSLAEKVVFMIQDHQADYEESLRLLSRDRRGMASELSQIPGLTVFPSQGNFILVKLPTDWSGVSLRDYLVTKHGVYTRECGNKLGMTSQFMRLVVRPAADVDRLIDGLDDYADDRRNSAAADPWSTGAATSWSTSAAPASPAPWSGDPATSRSSRPYPDPLTDASHASARSQAAGDPSDPRRSSRSSGDPLAPSRTRSAGDPVELRRAAAPRSTGQPPADRRPAAPRSTADLADRRPAAPRSTADLADRRPSAARSGGDLSERRPAPTRAAGDPAEPRRPAAARSAADASQPRRSSTSSGRPSSYADEPTPETGYDRRWKVADDDLAPYPPRRAAGY